MFVSAFLESYKRTRQDLPLIIAMECTESDDHLLIETCHLLVALKYGDAFECIRKVKDLKMSLEFRVIGLNLLATFYYLMGKGVEAMSLLDEALLLKPKDVDSNIKKSIALMEQGIN